MKWRCDVCGYVHEGDAPPDVCPVCGVGPDFFSAVEADGRDEPARYEEGEASERGGTRWRCVVCGYVHEGDEPPDVCPLCGVGSEFFEREGGAPKPRTPAPMGHRVVVVGGGVAGLTAVEAARKFDPQCRLTLITREEGLPYNRLELTRVLAGITPVDSLELQPAEWFASRHIDVVRAHVRALDLDERLVHLADGSTLRFDRLVLANGAHPFVPPWPGITRDGVQPLRTLDHTRSLLAHAREGAQVVVVGGGLLGLEAAGALAGAAAQVTVLEVADSLLPRQLPPRGGQLLLDHLQGMGISVRLGARLAEILGDEAVSAVLLEGGERLEAYSVVISIGIRSNIDLASRAGLEVQRGVVVDQRMATAHPRVWAAGDVAQLDGLVYGLWTASYLMGQVAGVNAAGGDATFAELAPSTRLKVIDLDVVWGGQIAGEGITLHETEEGGAYQALAVRDGVLVGYSLVGDGSEAARLQSRIGKPV